MNIIISAVDFLFNSFVLWGYNIIITPFVNLDALWILVPVYLSFLISEFFQEKRGTSRGNAISNSVIVLWGGIDFLRQTLNSTTDIDMFSHHGRIIIAAIIMIYGASILIAGFFNSDIIKVIGRIFIVAYFIIIFAPIYYTSTQLNWSYIFGAIIFFPMFYMAIELANKYMPDPKSLVDDIKEASGYDADKNNKINNKPNIGW